jgi:ubiquinone/menaquinone biosynthesis C-methylase UbiE
MDKTTETVRIFDKHAAQYQERYQSYAPYLATYDAFSKLLSKTHKTVLDVACGPGSFARYLLDRDPALEVTGIDLAPAMINLARGNVPEVRRFPAGILPALFVARRSCSTSFRSVRHDVWEWIALSKHPRGCV